MATIPVFPTAIPTPCLCQPLTASWDPFLDLPSPWLGAALLAGLLIGWLLQNTRAQQLTSAKARLEGAQRATQERLEALDTESQRTQETLRNESAARVRAEEALRHAQRELDDRRTELASLHTSLQDRFTRLTSELLDQTAGKWERNSQEKLEQLLVPFRESLDDFRRQAEARQADAIRGRGELHRHLDELKDLNRHLSEQADGLVSALRGDSQTQGAWGEFILESLLAKSGLEEGVEFEAQPVFTDDQGRTQRPDIVLHYPAQQGSLVIDSKVSLTAFQTFCELPPGPDREAALSEHVRSIQRHIRGLRQRRYEALPGLATPEFVLLFIPIEHAFNVAARAEPKLYDEAFESNIVLITPATLLATLKLIKALWRQDAQNRHAVEIAQRAGRLYDKFAGLYETVEALGTQLDRAREGHRKAMSQLRDGQGSLTTQVETLKKLGAKTSRQLPGSALSDAPTLSE